MKHLKLILALSLSVIMLSGFWSGKTKKEVKEENKKERVERHKLNIETLNLLYKYEPKARNRVLKAYGYATFTNIGVNIILFSAEGGKGLAHNNRTGQTTYMNMASAGVGFGLGIKDFRAVFLFKDKKAYYSFIEHGWEANAGVDAAAKVGKRGGAVTKAITVASGVQLYKLTQNGLAVQATVQGTKYWADSDLN